MSQSSNELLKKRALLRFHLLSVFFILVMPGAFPVYFAATGQNQEIGQTTTATSDSPSAKRKKAESLKKALALNPLDAEAHHSLGRLLLAFKDYDAAVIEFQISLRLRPDSFQFASDLALALTKIGEVDQAIGLYETLIRNNPGSPEIHSNYGLALWQRAAANRSHDLTPVIAAFVRALEYRPRDPGLYNNLGMVLKQNGDHPGAVECFSKAIQLRPDYAVARTNLGSVLRIMGRNDDALREIRTVLVDKADYAEAHYELGLLLRDRGDLKAAAEEFRRTVVLKPDYPEAYYALAITLRRLNLNSEAANALEKFSALAQARKSAYEATLHNSKGLEAARSGDVERAIGEFSEALRLNVRSATTHNNLGWALVRKKDLPSAIRSFRQAILLRNDYAMAYYNLGLALWSTGQEKEAEEALQRANRLDPRLTLPKFLAVLGGPKPE